jgi:hypothetical protein
MAKEFKNHRKLSVLSLKVFETKKSFYEILGYQELKIPEIQKISRFSVLIKFPEMGEEF